MTYSLLAIFFAVLYVAHRVNEEGAKTRETIIRASRRDYDDSDFDF